MGISCLQKILDYVVDVRTTVLVGSTDFRELFKLRCVNKEFQVAFVPTKLALPDQPNYEILAFLRLLPKMIPLLQSLDFNSCRDAWSYAPEWLEVLANCTSLLSLKLRIWRCSIFGHPVPLTQAPTQASFDLLVKSHTNLRRLSLTGNDNILDISALASLSKLERLNLSGNCNLTNISALASLSTLERLNLSGNHNISNISALASLSTLKTLKLNSLSNICSITPLSSLQGLECLQLTDTYVHESSECPNETLSKLTNLVTLFWSEDVHRLNESTLAALPMLTNLVLEDVSYFGDNHVLKTNKLTQLVSLRLSCSPSIDDAGLASFIGLKSLTAIMAPFCHSISDVGVASLASIPSLRGLCLTCVDELTDTGLKALTTLTNLNQLDVKNCMKITKVGLEVLTSALPNIRLEF